MALVQGGGGGARKVMEESALVSHWPTKEIKGSMEKVSLTVRGVLSKLAEGVPLRRGRAGGKNLLVWNGKRKAEKVMGLWSVTL